MSRKMIKQRRNIGKHAVKSLFFGRKYSGGDRKYRIFISTMSDIIIMIRIVLIS